MIRPSLSLTPPARLRRALLCACLAVATGTARAADALARIRDRGVLIVSVKNDGDPDRAAHKDPAHFQKRDFELDLARAFATHLLGDPSRVEFRMMPKPARLAALIEGRVDLVISMLVPRAGDRARVDFSRPYYALGAAVMHLADARPVRAPGDLAGLRLGFIARNQARPAASLGPGFGQPARRASFASFDEAAAAIERGDVDGLYSEALNIDAWLAAHPGRFVRSPALTREPVAVAVAKGNADLLGEVDALIADLAASGGLADLQLAHGLAAPAEVRRRPAAAPGP